MRVQEIWRYPVKSMAGEQLASAILTFQGVEGDRIVQVRRPDGKILTARTRPKLLSHHASLSPEGDVLVDDLPYTSDGIAADVEAAAGPGTRLVRSDAEDRFDILPLLIATDGMLQTAGYDRRRFRPNIVIGGVEGLAERTWEGRSLRVGEAVIGIEDLRSRCIMTTFDPDTGAQDVNVLKRIQSDFGGKLGLNCYVIQPGHIAVGDPVELVAQ